MTLSSECCEQKEVKTALLRNNNTKLSILNVIEGIFTNIVEISSYSSL
jgi:hypothetical protein